MVHLRQDLPLVPQSLPLPGIGDAGAANALQGVPGTSVDVLHKLHDSKSAPSNDTDHSEIIEANGGILQLDPLLNMLDHSSIHNGLEHFLVNHPELHFIYTVHNHISLSHIVGNQRSLAKIVELSPALQQLVSIVDADLPAPHDVELIARGALFENCLSALHLDYRYVRHQLVHVLLRQMAEEENLPDVFCSLSQLSRLHDVVSMQHLSDIASVEHSHASVTHGAPNHVSEGHQLVADVVVNTEGRSAAARSIGSTDSLLSALGVRDVQLTLQHHDTSHTVHALLAVIQHLVLARAVLNNLGLLSQSAAGTGWEA
mmetsp:Transcript_21814/g.47867  ORF Transcript_21814/g.47867 Transcript_21814/m.47867 type:complete len:315 (+) Transcript_21814:929-1873(+)